MKLKVILVLFCVLFYHHLIAQNGDKEANRIMPPSPTAGSLGKYGEIPVSMYTGTPNINIPLYEVKSGDLSVPISLSYHSASVKPNEIPGWVGLGWSLNAGGVISRTVRDIPDDSDGFSAGTGTGFYYDLISPAPKFNQVFDDLSLFPFPANTTAWFWDNDNRQNDQKPDDFSFNFGGYSGQFFFGQDAQIHMRSQQPLKINFELAINSEGGTIASTNHHIKSWTILTGDGVKYTFEAKEWSYSPMGQALSAYVSAWYLTLIESSSGEQISFEYTEVNGKIRAKEFKSHRIGYIKPSGSSSMPIVDIDKIGSSVSLDEVIYLKKINFTNGYIQFNTVKRNDPQYVPSGYNGLTAEEQKLDLVELYSQNTTPSQKLLSWKLNYTEVNRLKLISIIKSGSSGSDNEATLMEYEPTTFEGNTGNANYPNPYDINAIDHWGYYNGNASLTKMPVHANPTNPNAVIGDANRDANGMATASLLQKITWPTGGNTIFEFEPNDYSVVVVPNPNPLPTLTWVNYQDYYISGPATGSYECPGNPEEVTFTLPRATIIRKMIIEKWVHNDIVPCTSEYFTTTYSQDIFLEAGTYNLNDVFNNRLMNDCNAIPSGPIQGNAPINCLEYVRYLVAVPYSYNNGNGPAPGIFITGGTRIKKIISNDGFGNTLTKTYKYKKGNVSSGVLNKDPIYLEPDLSFPGYGFEVGVLGGFLLSSNPIKSVPSGSHIGYSEVSEELENGSKTVHTFTTYEEYPDGEGFEFADLNYGPMINNDMQRGLPTTTVQYNSAGNIVKFTSLEYDFSQNEYMGRMVDNTYIFTTNSPDSEGMTAASKILIPSRFVAKKSETERIYDPENQTRFLERKTEYKYNLNNLQVKETKTTNSKNENILSLAKYPVDYSGGVYDLMKTQNMILLPVEQKTIKEGATVELNLRKYDYQAVAGQTFVKPSAVSSSVKGNQLETEITFDRYDQYGNILQQTKKSGPVTSYLWGYQNNLPVAEVINAKADDIAYTSFEDENNGNWLLTDQTRNNSESVTGKKAYKLVNGTPVTKSTLTASQNYVITYWSKNGAANVNGISATSLLQKNGWTLFKHSVSGVTSVSVTGNNILIDELRLYPANATMSTVTYDPLVGVTSQCNSNNTISYFEYEPLLRLLRIRDADKNILKQFDYKLKTPPHSNPVWEFTGTTRCKPCEINNNYVLNITQKQEKDNNPNSSSFGQLRWTDGPAGSCVITPDWQNTVTAIRCRKNGSNQNTGEQEREQKDMNPCSPTYNQTRWTVVGTNTTACPLPFPYAKLTIENYNYSGSTTTADVIVRFYADAAMTIPVSVQNILVNYVEDVSGSICGCTISNSNLSFNCSGEEVILQSQVPIFFEQNGSGEVDQISTWYTLRLGTGYIGGQ